MRSGALLIRETKDSTKLSRNVLVGDRSICSSVSTLGKSINIIRRSLWLTDHSSSGHFCGMAEMLTPVNNIPTRAAVYY